MLVKTPEGEMKDVQIYQSNSNEYAITPQNYVVPEGEEGNYHAILEVKQFDSASGQRISIPRIQKFGPKWFDSMDGESDLKKQGYSIIVLHDPKKWMAKNQSKIQEQKEKAAQDAIDKKAELEAEKQAEADAALQLKINELVAAGVAAALANQTKAVTEQPKVTVKQPEVIEKQAPKEGDKK